MSITKILGVIDEDPFDPMTWSGSSAYFFRMLKDRGVLVKAISAQPSIRIKYLYKGLSFQPKIEKWKFKYYLNTEFYRKMTQAAKEALKRVEDNDYQVILQVGAWYDMTGYLGKPVVSYHDGNLATLLVSPYGYPRISEAYIRRTLAYERDLYSRINLIFTMSRYLEKSFICDFNVSPEKVFPVGAGINLPRIADTKNKNYENPHILFVGKDFKRKGGEVLLKAFEIVRKKIKNAELTIIGTRLKSPPKGVRSTGFLSKFTKEGIDTLLNEYTKASVFVMPSLYEPFGIVFAEAMAHRLPCIGTNLCAMPEIIQHGKTGYIVPPNDIEELAERMILLLKDHSLCREFGEAGYDSYAKNYNWAIVAERMCRIIDIHAASRF